MNKELKIKTIPQLLEFVETIEKATELVDYINNLQNQLEEKTYLYNKLDIESKYVINNLQKENAELKMTNLALADDITKNKIIKQEALTECCGIPIGEIPMLKIQNDEYKQRIDKAIEKIESLRIYGLRSGKTLIATLLNDILDILKGEE